MRFLSALFLIVMSSATLAGGKGVQAPQLSQPDQESVSQKAISGEQNNNSDTSPTQQPMLNTYKASYSASYNGMPITTERTFSKSGEAFILKTSAHNLFGSIEEEEAFSFSGSGEIQPLYYRYKRSIFGKKREENTDFDYDSEQVTNTYKKTTRHFPLGTGLLGPMSYQHQLRADLLNGKTEFTYPVITRGKIKAYHYLIEGNETIATELGMLKTVMIKRQRNNDKRETYLWLAIDLGYLPVKLVQIEGKERYEMLINTYNLDNTEQKGL